MDPLAFYCVSERGHFLGLVALINSLRLVGHSERIYVLDLGLERWQIDLLRPEALVIESVRDDHPCLLKHVLPLQHPAEVMVLLDVDIIVTTHLRRLVAQAELAQKPVLFLNDRTDRFHPEWAELGFGFPVPHRYITAGQFVLPARTGEVFLREFAMGQRRLDLAKTLVNPRVRPQEPFYYLEMDVLNAMIGTEFSMDSFTIADPSTVSYWPFRSVRLIDAHTLECAFPDGQQPLLLHHIMAKPWKNAVAPNIYTMLLTRLLCGTDVAIKVPMSAVPLSLRRGLTASIVRYSFGARGSLRNQLRGKLRIRARLAGLSSTWS